MKLIIGITGASGAIFGVEFIKRCAGDKSLVLSKWGKAVLYRETGLAPADMSQYVNDIYSNDDMNSPFASGSYFFDAMVIIPCSVATLGKIANGIADNLITRAAEVALKERRRLILCVRETPLSVIDLENAVRVSHAGAIVAPISPPFYTNPKTLEDIITSYLDKIFSLIEDRSQKTEKNILSVNCNLKPDN